MALNLFFILQRDINIFFFAFRLGQQMAEMPIEPRLAKCLLASLSDANCNTTSSDAKVQPKSTGREENLKGCTEEMLSIAAMCSVDYPFVSLKAKASDERKQQRLGAFEPLNDHNLLVIQSNSLSYLHHT